MAEEVETDVESKKKLNSRKFIVWVVWVLIALTTLVIGVISMIITKNFPEDIVDLIKLTLGYLFYVSLVYLGVNGIQKVGFAISDAMSNGDKK